MTEQSLFKIESNDLAIAQIFKDFYAVPDFRREYVWEREHVEKLLEAQISDAYSDPRTGEDVERHRLTLQYEDSDGILEKLVKADQPVSDLPETTESVRKILAAYRTI